MTVTPKEVLRSQVTTLVDDLSREHSTVTGSPQAQAAGQLVSTTLATQLKRCLTEVLALRDQLSNGTDFAQAWNDFQRLRAVATDLFGESLAISLAPLVRVNEVDRHMCSVADRLLHSASTAFSEPWPHFTILSESEYFGTTAQLIRIRYPATHLWDLSIAAHEFGHFFGPKWRSGRRDSPYTLFLDRSGLGPRAYAQELFADLFAVFWLGPAYACTCILRRFNPLEPGSDSHPSHVTRAVWILSCLALLLNDAGGEGVSTIGSVHSRLEAYWSQALVESRVADGKERQAALAYGAQGLWRSLLHDFPDAVYSDVSPALSVVADFREGRAAADVRGRYLLRDLLNGLWLLRLQHESAPLFPTAALEDWGKRVCMEASA